MPKLVFVELRWAMRQTIPRDVPAAVTTSHLQVLYDPRCYVHAIYNVFQKPSRTCNVSLGEQVMRQSLSPSFPGCPKMSLSLQFRFLKDGYRQGKQATNAKSIRADQRGYRTHEIRNTANAVER